VADRVVQAALKLVLEPIFEADFVPVSYGFRPMRRAHDAIAEIHHFGTCGYRWVLDADIEACFDSIDHTALMDRVRRRVKDKRVLLLVKAFLKAGILTELGENRETHTGTPQGGLCSAEHNPPYAQCRVMRSAGVSCLVGPGRRSSAAHNPWGAGVKGW
jgi:RNA-directed DNA polymerase